MKRIIAIILLLSGIVFFFAQSVSSMIFADPVSQNGIQLNRIARQLQRHQSADEAAGYPGVKRIGHDLIGHSLAEGVENGYRPTDWRWTVEEGQISRLAIVKVLERTKKQYVLIVRMRLSNGYYAYDAKTRIKYVRTVDKRWKLDYAVSLGMRIVVTHEFDDLVRAAVVEDGWGGTYCVQFSNLSEMSLAVGGDFLNADGWQRFSLHLAPHGVGKIGGLFAGGSVSDYRINFIVRIN